MSKTTSMDMLHGPILKKIIIFALPLGLSSILQQLFNSADVMVVGRFANAKAMAAVGANAPIISLVVTAIVGLSIGANVLIAQYIGQEKTHLVKKAVHSIMALSLVIGIITLVAGLFFSRMILLAISTPADVLSLAVSYLRIYFIGMPFIVIYNFGSSILRSVGDSRRPLYCLFVSGILNVLLNLFFVIGFHMSSNGVALATTISNAVSSLMIIIFLKNETGMLHLNIREIHLSADHTLKILRIGGPAAIQGMVFSFSNIIIQSAINSFGSNAVAGISAGMNFEYFAYYISNAFAQTAVTFTSQNYAAHDYGRVRRVFYCSMLSGFCLTAIASALFIIFRYPLIHIFTNDELVVKYAMYRMFYSVALEALTGTYEIPGSCLRGMGYSMLPAVITIFGSCVLRLIFIATYFRTHHTFAVLSSIYPITWIITGAMMMVTYFILQHKLLRD